jgi:hypothetical protein
MLRGIRKQMSLVDRSMLWLKELYIQLFYENGGYEPLASDALRVGETFNIPIFTRIYLNFQSYGKKDNIEREEEIHRNT